MTQERLQETGETMEIKLTAVFRKVAEGYIGFVEELPGANTQGDTLEETRENLREAIQLVLEANRALSEESLLGQEVIREPLVICPA
jgi:predicted RNase H-like HicB family nuclease